MYCGHSCKHLHSHHFEKFNHGQNFFTIIAYLMKLYTLVFHHNDYSFTKSLSSVRNLKKKLCPYRLRNQLLQMQGSAEDEIWGYSPIKIEILPLKIAERGSFSHPNLQWVNKSGNYLPIFVQISPTFQERWENSPHFFQSLAEPCLLYDYLFSV